MSKTRVRLRAPIAAVAAVLVSANGGVGHADVVRDGRVGSAGPGAVATEVDGDGGIRHLIRESDGERSGQNLFHSFSRMDLSSNETAVYQGDAGIRNLVTTITGGRSSIDGKIESEIAGANLFLINPDGVVFGENATVDLSGALVVSTADRLIFSNGDEMETGGAAPPSILSVADPVGFGFLDSPASIEVVGSRIRLTTDRSLSLIGGDIELSGGRTDDQVALVATRSGRIDLVSLASAGQVLLEPDGIRIEGNPLFGDITIADEMSVTTSGIDPDPFQGFFSPPGLGSGDIFVRADDLHIRDAEVRTLTVTSGDAGDIDIDLTGALTIEGVSSDQATGIFADTGFRSSPRPGQVITIPNLLIQGWGDLTTVVGDGCGVEICSIQYRAVGDAGDVRIHARDVSLRNGGKITATSEFFGDAGTIEIDFEREMTIAGRRGPGDVSLMTTNANGAGNPGEIRLRSDAGTLRLDDFGGLVIQNGSASRATGLPGRIEVDVAELSLSGNARIDSSTRGAGPGGILDITARDRLTLRGRTDDEFFTGISTLSQPGSSGNAGEIRIATAELIMEDGAEISARPVDATSLGAAGSLRFEIGDRLVMRDATISTESPNAAGGNIDLAVGDVVDMRRSSIKTSVTSGPENAGNITLRPGPEALVLDQSQIIAGADAGTGGLIDIEAGVVIRDDGSSIEAPAGPTGIAGVVLINGVEGNIVPEVAALAMPAADASKLLREPCAARRPGASNRFVVDDRRLVAVDADDYLAAPLGALLGSREPGSELPSRAKISRGDEGTAVSGDPQLALEEREPSSDCTL